MSRCGGQWQELSKKALGHALINVSGIDVYVSFASPHSAMGSGHWLGCLAQSAPNRNA